ncbi:unnamed protein product [Ophioblennius macclurei]
MAGVKYSWLDFSLSIVGLVILVMDVVLDVMAVVDFYQAGAYVTLGLLVLFLVGSSFLVQIFSWLWYKSDNFEFLTSMEQRVSRQCLGIFHLFQLGIYFRHLGMLEISLKTFCMNSNDESQNTAAYLSHDLSMLRIVETFSESAPQLVLMLTILVQKGDPDPITVMKAVASASALAFSVTMYQRSLRSFLPDTNKQTVKTSLVFYFWNLLLISSRLVALALFASVLPCFIIAHFFCSWMLFFFFAWMAKTDFMDGNVCGEWLYRATVALIWYFDWFNVIHGKTRYKTLLYHGFILADISMLCFLWFWEVTTPEYVIPPQYAAIAAATVIFVYILGLIFKVVYYRFFHPNVVKEELRGKDDEVDTVMFRSFAGPRQAPPPEPCNKRMRKLAENFYT